MKLNITGYGDNLTVNGMRIGDLTPKEHEEIEKTRGGQNYSPCCEGEVANGESKQTEGTEGGERGVPDTS